jgi:zinc protease
MTSANRLLPMVLLAASLPVAAGPKIHNWLTPNGARVLFVAAPELPMLDIRVVFDAGSARDGDRPGVAQLTNFLLDQGAGDWNADQIAERVENVGAQLDNGALRDMAWQAVRTLTREPALETAVDTLAAIISRPGFAPADLERLRQTALVGISQDDQDPRSVASKAWYRTIYGSHPYGADPAGTRDSLAALTRDDLLAHYRRHYVAANAVVALVGAVTREQAEAIATRITAGLATGTRAPALPPVADLEAATLEQIPFPSSQSHVYVGQPGMTRTDPDYFPLYIGNHILGGNGLVSRLSDEVREQRGLSYSVYSYFLPMQQRGPFLMGLQTRNDQAGGARQVLMDTLRRFREHGPETQELEDAKRNLTGSFPLRIASNALIVEYLAMIGFYDLPLDYLDTLNARTEAVTAEQIRDAFRRRLDPERFATVVVGAAERMADQ